MTPDQIFSLANLVAALSWLLLVALPRRSWVTGAVTRLAVPGLFAAAYVAIAALTFFGSDGSFSSLDGVARLFENRWLLLAGWLHYLAFDLLIGTWQVLDSQQRGMPHLLVVPCLLLTFLFGPAGWLLYTVVSRWRYSEVGIERRASRELR
jgi:hypothetical protein